jgi:prepilin-type processing-associated H-X9-DG protein
LSLLELLVAIAIISVILGLSLAAVQRVRASAARTQCANKLHQLGLAHQQYHQTHGAFPPGVSYADGKDPYPFLGWQARLLPYLEQRELWDQTVAAFKQDPVFWNDPPHTGLATVVPAFLCPADDRVTSPATVGSVGLRAFTSYLGVEGTNAGVVDGVLYLDSKCRLADVTDGSSNTLLVGERPPSADLVLGWWYAGWGQRKNGDGDMLLGVRSRNYAGYGPGCPEGPYHFTPGAFKNQCDAFHFWSPHAGGAHFALADGSVRFLSYSADPVMPALATRAGGEVASPPD